MSIKKGYIEEQIAALSKALIALVFGKERLAKLEGRLEDEEAEQTGDTMEDDIVKTMVDRYLITEDIAAAENLIISSIEKHKSAKNLLTALMFYNKLLELDDAKLSELGTSKEEVEKSINNLKELYDEE
jgi:hypothetical protein